MKTTKSRYFHFGFETVTSSEMSFQRSPIFIWGQTMQMVIVILFNNNKKNGKFKCLQLQACQHIIFMTSRCCFLNFVTSDTSKLRDHKFSMSTKLAYYCLHIIHVGLWTAFSFIQLLFNNCLIIIIKNQLFEMAFELYQF